VDDFIVSGLLNEKTGARKDLKGKGKAVDKEKERAPSYDMDIDPDNRMNDITNNSAFSLDILCAQILIIKLRLSF
jgi:hypothetical protein